MIVLFQEFIDYKILKKRPFDTTRFNACRIVDFKQKTKQARIVKIEL